MSRPLVTLGVILAAGVGLAVLAGLLAYGPRPVRSGTMDLPGLVAPVEIGWDEEGRAHVEAQSEADLATGLGYVHGADAAWTMALLRQAARGTLAAWFGPTMAPLDEHARRLGFRALARETYGRLGAPERALLDGYARGVNRAFESGGTHADEFVLFDVEAAPWEPADALAVERLVAWLATPALHEDSAFVAAARRDRALQRFGAADSAFRAFLGVGPFQGARAWATADGPLVQSHPYGRTALPLFREASLRLGARAVAVATVPGTLALPAGHGAGASWAVFLTADAAFGPAEGAPPPPVFDRIVDRDGNETLLEFARAPSGLYLPAEPIQPPLVRRPPPAPARPDTLDTLGRDTLGRDTLGRDTLGRDTLGRDTLGRDTLGRDTLGRGSLREPPVSLRDSTGSARPANPPRPTLLPSPTPVPIPDSAATAPPTGWTIRWAGFAPGTDLGAWRALLAGRAPDRFALLRGDGLFRTGSGASAVLGAPPIREALTSGVFVAADRRARWAGARLAALLADSARGPTSEALAGDPFSAWAARTAPPLVVALGDREALPDSLQDAHAFLRGWDFRYTPDAIGASVFETWLVEHRRATGALPARPDSADGPLLRQTLARAVDSLRARHGEAAGGWRWARVQPGARPFPAWPAGDTPARFAPDTLGPGGHPTALRAGPSLVDLGAPAPAVWTAWTEGPRLLVRHPVVPTRSAFARLRAPDAASRALDPAARPAERLTLRPPLL